METSSAYIMTLGKKEKEKRRLWRIIVFQEVVYDHEIHAY